MGNTLIIAEKPSVAGSIAAGLGANKRQDGYFEGNGYYVSYAFGHLYTLADTKDYNPDMEGSWNLKDYPFIPKKFEYKPIDDPGIKKQLKTLKSLADKADLIINSCDGDREGELIFAEINNNLHFNKPIKRLWITSHTPKDIQKGMSELKDGLVNLEKAGYCRQQIDWIIGINLTAIYTLKAGGEITLKLGRVVLPTLKLIFDREVAIANFKSETFYTIKNKFKTNDDEFYVGTYYDNEGNSRILDKTKAIELQEKIKNKPGSIIKKESKKAYENPQKLFNLTDLQGYITDKYPQFTADEVLAVLQSLYEKKFATYPRTASRYLDDTQVESAKESLYAVIDIAELNIEKDKVKFHTDKKVFDSSKVDSHPAIIPTYVIPEFNSLSEKEIIVYTEITKRFISQFMQAAVYDTLEMVTKIDQYEFITKGRVLIDKGWKQLYSKGSEDKAEDKEQEEEEINAKNTNVGDAVISEESELKEGQTKPPAHYTNKTLLTAMENCGKTVENEDEILKGYTIGTPATRGDTISKLFDCGYISQKGKNILITDLGLKVIHYFPVKKLLRTDFTGQIEKTLKDIENNEYDSKVFMEKMTSYILKNIEEMKNSEIPKIKRPVNIIGKCPKCGKNVVETTKAYSCEGTRTKECNFTLWKDSKFFSTFGKKLTETIAKDIVNKGKATVSGMKNPKKEGEKFKATISIAEDPETGYWNYKFVNNESNGKGSVKKSFKKQPKKTLKFK